LTEAERAAQRAAEEAAERAAKEANKPHGFFEWIGEIFGGGGGDTGNPMDWDHIQYP
jgi:hypothetical protein